jgi:hypothetical protein
MRDLVRDWRRWTPVERMLAAALATLAALVPALLAIAGHAP